MDDVTAPPDQLAMLRAEIAEFRAVLFERLGAIGDGVEELLADSRRARPLLDKYDRFAKMPWAPKAARR